MKKITNRQIAKVARLIWRMDADDGRETIRAVFRAFKIPHETPRRRRR